MHSSPSLPPDASRLGLSPLNSRPRTCAAREIGSQCTNKTERQKFPAELRRSDAADADLQTHSKQKLPGAERRSTWPCATGILKRHTGPGVTVRLTSSSGLRLGNGNTGVGGSKIAGRGLARPCIDTIHELPQHSCRCLGGGLRTAPVCLARLATWLAEASPGPASTTFAGFHSTTAPVSKPPASTPYCRRRASQSAWRAHCSGLQIGRAAILP